MGNKEGKRPQDLFELYIDHYIEEPDDIMSQQEIDELQAEIDAENARNGY